MGGASTLILEALDLGGELLKCAAEFVLVAEKRLNHAGTKGAPYRSNDIVSKAL